MKKLILSVLSLLLIMSACTKVELDQELKWTVGEDAEMVIKEVNASKEIKIEMERSSLCYSEGIKLIVEENGSIKFEKIIKNFPFSKTLNISKNSDIKITTKTELNINGVLCVLEGNADVLLSY